MKKVLFWTVFSLVAVSAVVGALAFSHAVASGKEGVILQDYKLMRTCATAVITLFLVLVFPDWLAAIKKRLKF